MHGKMYTFCVLLCLMFPVGISETFAGTDKAALITVTQDGVTLSNTHMMMNLGGDKSMFRVRQIISKSNPGRNLISENDPTIGLWKLHLCDSKGKDSLLETSEKPEVTGPVSTSNGEKIILSWTRVKGVDIDVTVELIVDDSRFIRTKLNVNNNSEYRLKQISFPQIAGLGPFGDNPGNDKLIWPRTSGQLLDLPYKNGVPGGYFEEFPYPSASQSMQFTGIYGNDGGIYLAAYDSQCNIKRLHFSKRSSGKSINFLLKNFPENIDKPGNDYAMSYDAVITTFDGEWWDAGEIYRTWALAQPWVRKTTVLKDETVSPEFKDIVMWMGLWGPPSLVESQNWKSIIEYFSVKMCAHWYSWHQAPYDTAYPFLLPAHEGLDKTVARLQGMGMIIMPYTNVRLWGEALRSFNELGAIQGGVLNENGQGVLEEYNYRQFLVMCPFSRFWEDTLVAFCQNVCKETGSRALYLDQLSAAGPVLCFNERHGHKAGGGNYWSEGYNNLLVRLKSEMKGKSLFFTGESFTESYSKYMDGYLLWLAFSQNDIPLAQMIYGGRTVFWGHTFVREDLQGNAFYVKLGRMLVRGIQPGWTYAWVMSPKAKKQREFLRQIVHLYDRTLHKEAFLDGTMHRPPVLSGLGGAVTTRLFRQKGDADGISVTCEPVLAGAWELSNGQYRILLVNVSDLPQSFKIDLRKYVGGKIREAKIDFSDRTAGEKFELNDNVANIELSPKKAAVIMFTPKGK